MRELAYILGRTIIWHPYMHMHMHNHKFTQRQLHTHTHTYAYIYVHTLIQSTISISVHVKNSKNGFPNYPKWTKYNPKASLDDAVSVLCEREPLSCNRTSMSKGPKTGPKAVEVRVEDPQKTTFAWSDTGNQRKANFLAMHPNQSDRKATQQTSKDPPKTPPSALNMERHRHTEKN